MTLLTVPWPLPKASVEYAWVQPHKLQLSALKSVGSPTQQMGGGSERKLTERERAEKRKLVWLIFNGWKINQISSLFASALQRQRQEGVCTSRHADSQHTTTCARWLCFPRSCVRMHAAVCALEYGSAFECVYASAFVSVCPYHFAWSSGQLPGNCGRGRLSARAGQTLPHAYGFW